MIQQNKLLYFFFFSFLMSVLLSGCKERAINPFEDDQGIYSIYGALEIGKNQNIIRVKNLLEPFSASSATPFDATVTFTDLGNNATTQLRDTTVDYEVGKTHNFILEENLELDSQYRITVERSDGEMVSSIATTPGETDASYFPQMFINCETAIRFSYGNVKLSEFIEMEIGAEYQGDIHWAEMDLVGDIEYDYQQNIGRVTMSPRNLLVEVFPPILPDNPYYDPYKLFPTVTCSELDSNVMRIRYKHFGPEWSTGRPILEGQLDIDSGDIENGLGFFGAYRVGEFSITFSEEPDNPDS